MHTIEVTNMEWTKEKVHEAVLKQREFFASNVTLDVKWRIIQLKKLRDALIRNEEKLEKALNDDLGRHPFEAYLCDIGPTIMEINEIIHHLKRWAKPENHRSGIMCFPSTNTKVYKMPYGVSLIISPFNFPILLTIGVLAASISAGNTSIIKTSSKSSACTKAMQEIIAETYPEEFITVIDGGHDVADFCLEERVDKIFYTGSPNIAKHVMEYASRNLTPVALELGGETGNWAIVRKDANLEDAADKIAFFKILNSGQICININQVAVAEEVADQFVEIIKSKIHQQISDKPLENPEYPHLIGTRAYAYCKGVVEAHKELVVSGGNGDEKLLKFEPTILYPVDINDSCVNEELFCPILPIVKFKDSEIDDLLKIIAEREHGLALYLFTKNKKWAKKVMSSQQYGGGCVNEVCVHLMVKGVPFGGTGHSGMGAYHGEWGFREFSHPSTVLFGRTHGNLSIRKHPYSDKKLKLIRKLMK